MNFLAKIWKLFAEEWIHSCYGFIISASKEQAYADMTHMVTTFGMRDAAFLKWFARTSYWKSSFRTKMAKCYKVSDQIIQTIYIKINLMYFTFSDIAYLPFLIQASLLVSCRIRRLGEMELWNISDHHNNRSFRDCNNLLHPFCIGFLYLLHFLQSKMKLFSVGKVDHGRTLGYWPRRLSIGCWCSNSRSNEF